MVIIFTNPFMTENILLLLDHFTDDLYVAICKSLNLELYIEDQTTTISGNKFVVDIVKKENTQSVLLYFLEENYQEFFEHLKTYFDVCLAQKNMKLFYYLLKFLSKIERSKNESKFCKIIKNQYFEICQCVFSNVSTVEFIDDVVKKGNGYNIFTHRHERLFVYNNYIFNFYIVDNETYFCNKKISEFCSKKIGDFCSSDFCSNDLEHFECMKDEIRKRFDFYKNVNEKYVLGEERININDTHFIDTNLSVYDDKNVRNKQYSFLLKKGFTIHQILDVYSEL